MTEAPSIIDEMYLEGLEMKRAQFRRDHPALSAAEIEALVASWIADRPFDAPGRIRTR